MGTSMLEVLKTDNAISLRHPEAPTCSLSPDRLAVHR